MRRPVSIVALALTALLVVGCSAQPVSQAGVESPAASDGSSPAPSAAASAGASPADTSSPAAPSASTSAPTPTPAPVTGPPPKPADPTWVLVSEVPDSSGKSTETYQVSWTEPNGAASKFLVYGLPECLLSLKKYDGTPCVVPGMKIPVAHLVLLGSAAGDARSMNVSWKTDGGAGPAKYQTILMRATNSLGKSIFTIVHAENVCFGCTY